MKSAIVNQVRELLERHWSAAEIASKLKIDIEVVLAAINLLS